MNNRNVYIAIPVMDEPQTASFLRRLALQTRLPYMVVVCVNQPKKFWDNEGKRHIAETNVRVLKELQMLIGGALPFTVEIIDCCTVGTDEKHIGVGWARKYALDFIDARAVSDDIMIWMDADTVYPDNYIEEVVKVFEQDTRILALTAPYYHLIEGFDERRVEGHSPEIDIRQQIAATGHFSEMMMYDDFSKQQQIAALHYEVYMRAYLINLYRSGHPYAFTAIGSGIASTVKAYRKAGGLTPVKSGEDFYFIQKLFKTGKVIAWCNTVCNPSIRASNRVFFGTGPAISKGLADDWKSYPIYPFSLFEKIGSIYQEFGKLWDCEKFDRQSIITKTDLQKFQTNARTKEQFVKFCTEKFDALRTL
ncbi:MAG: glycosyltransferase, partial [Bacteroidales bacterium]|nr:glycosyltransferase [Bacteroidales bacterium]